MEACQQSSNDRTSETQVSVSKCSCFCVCLRLGLFVLILLKTGINLSLLGLLILGMSVVSDAPTSTYSAICLGLIYVAIFIDGFDSIMGLFLIISYCVQYEKFMEIYHKRSIYIYIILTVLCCLIMYMILPHMWHVIQLLCFLIPCLLIQLFVNYILKNDILAMRIDEDCRV